MKLEHIGIAVRSIEEGAKIWEDVLGLTPEAITEVKSQKVRVAVFDARGVKIELLEPMGDDSPIAKFLEKKGEGLHHLCFEVKNLEKALMDIKSRGIKLVDEVPRRGAFAKKIAFLHPGSIHGVLIELCEK